jgi:hypothetical protein
MRDHSLIDDRSLAFGLAIAARLRQDPSQVNHAKNNLKRWFEICSPQSRPALEEWWTALQGPIDGVIQLLTGTDERAIRLRQSNPFAGILPEGERNAILREYLTHDAARA